MFAYRMARAARALSDWVCHRCCGWGEVADQGQGDLKMHRQGPRAVVSSPVAPRESLEVCQAAGGAGTSEQGQEEGGH